VLFVDLGKEGSSHIILFFGQVYFGLSMNDPESQQEVFFLPRMLSDWGALFRQEGSQLL